MNRITPIAIAIMSTFISGHAITKQLEPSACVRLDGKSHARIVISPDALETTKYAARELQLYIDKSLGIKAPIVDTPATSSMGITFLVGDSASVKAMGIDPQMLKSDGFIIQVKPQVIALVGRDEPVPYIENKAHFGRYEMGYNEKLKLCGTGQTGTLFAVYHFLEKYLGIRWIWPGDLGEVVPRHKSVLIPVGRNKVEPRFELRMYYAFNFARDDDAAKWYRRAGFGSTSDPMWPNHSAWLIYSVPENHSKHPEWFAIHNGARHPVDLCWSEPTLVDEWTRLALEYFRNNPQAKMFPIVPEDGTGACECSRCQAKLDLSPPREGDGSIGGNQKMSRLLLPVVNEVARRVRGEFPDRFIGTLAYATYLKPPAGEKVEPNVVLMFCAGTHWMYEKLYRDTMLEYEKQWIKQGAAHFSLWDYQCYHLFLSGNNGPYIPVIMPHALKARYARTANYSRGFFAEAENENASFVLGKLTHYGMDHVNWYVMGKLGWNPNLNVDDVLDDYCKSFFGPAASSMRKFWDVQEKAWFARDDQIQWDGVATARWNHVYTQSVLRKMFKHLDTARAIARKSADPSYLKRIELINGEYAVLRSCMLDGWDGPNGEVANNSFEDWDAGTCAFWNISGDGTASTAYALTGKRSLKLTGEKALAIHNAVQLENNSEYVVSVWIRTEGKGNPDAKNARPTLSVLAVNADGSTSVLASSTSRPGAGNEWQRMFVVCWPTPQIQIKLSGCEGFVCYYDDVSVERLKTSF